MTVSSYTPNFKLALIDFNSQNWQGDAWDNLNLIDAILKADFASAPFAVASGTNTLAITYVPAIVAYTSGLTLLFKLSNTPTGAMTINVNGLGAKAIKIAGADVVQGDLSSGDVVRALYDGTQFCVLEPVRVFNKLTVRNGGYGGSGPASTADDVVIDLNVSGGISILTPATAVGTLAFGDPNSNVASSISYNHNNGRLTFAAETGSYFGTVNATSFVGPVTGNVTGNVTGDVSGNAANVTGTVAINHGGTGATSASAARSALGLGTASTLDTIDIAHGGTGATTASAARAALGVVSNTGDSINGSLGVEGNVTTITSGSGTSGGVRIRAGSSSGNSIIQFLNNAGDSETGTIRMSSSKLTFYVGTTAVFSVDSSGNIKCSGNITASTSP